MKKIVVILIMIQLVFALSACGKTEETDFGGLIREVDFSMTKEDVVALEKSTSGMDYTREVLYEGEWILYYLDAVLDGYSGILSYRFKESGTLGFVHFTFHEEQDYITYLEAFREKYGKSTEKEQFSEYWEGLVAGREVRVSFAEDLCLVEIAECGNETAQTEESVEVLAEQEVSAEPDVPTEPDYLLEEAFALSVGDEVLLEDGIRFRLEALDYVSDTQKYRVDYVMNKEGEAFPGRYFMAQDGTTSQYVEVFNLHPVTLVDVNNIEATFIVSAAPEIPAPMEISGNAEDSYTAEDYAYLEGEKFVVYLDKGVTFRGNIMADLETVMAAVEQESGLEFYAENEYSILRTEGIRELYFGTNPWPGVNEFHEKVGIYVVNRPEEHYVSCALNDSVIITAQDFDVEASGVYALAHELSHLINMKNGEQLNQKLSEGFACYMGSRVAKSLPQYAESPQAKWNYYGGFTEQLDSATAEQIFFTDYNDYAHSFKEYQLGMYLMTYLYETYGDTAFPELLSAVNKKNSEFYTQPTKEMEAEALKECFSEKVFEEFGDWYQENMSRFMGEE